MAQETQPLSVSEALQKLLAKFSPLEIIQIPLAQAVGRVLGDPILAPISLPPFANSAMDGFAVRSEDVAEISPENPLELQVVADILAGSALETRIGPGQTARIMTGAPIPEGADAVIPVEDTNIDFRQAGLEPPTIVQLRKPVSRGENVRPAGQDLQAGQRILQAGQVIRPQDAGLLSMLGVAMVGARRKPRVAVFSSGDELIPADAPLKPGKIRDANIYILAGLVESCGAEALNLGVAPDRPEQVRKILQKALQMDVDLVISSAGVSVGAMDFVRTVIEQEGQLEFWRVNIRPGKPMAFGYYQERPFIGLPGNPVSAFTGFEVFVRPLLQKMLGRPALERPQVEVRVLEDIHSDGRESYLRAIVSQAGDERVARLTGHQGSGNLFSLVQANALLLIPSAVKYVPSGSRLYAWLLNDG